ncbi:unnamed protein product [Acanthosepion pharaonis]|uniref:Uncharacterized protein n=1 Tax=Acanthosepion pharaonis TaxID=158019 RepID=A0A812C7R7_ACAPH|nr:unnamed protein product [Sepia pharaonis]
MLRAPGVTSVCGRDHRVSLGRYRPPQAGHPPANHHSLLALLGAWNGRTLRPGLADDIQQIDDARKTTVIDKEHSRLGTDITCLQETRLADSGSIRETNYTFFWQGWPQDDPRQHGVGLAVRNSLILAIEPPTGESERILALRLSTSTGFANVLCIYAPTLCANTEYPQCPQSCSQQGPTDCTLLCQRLLAESVQQDPDGCLQWKRKWRVRRNQNRYRLHSHQDGSAEVHYLKLYATQNVVTDATLDDLISLPVMEEFDALPSASSAGVPWEGCDPIGVSEEWKATSAVASPRASVSVLGEGPRSPGHTRCQHCHPL